MIKDNTTRKGLEGEGSRFKRGVGKMGGSKRGADSVKSRSFDFVGAVFVERFCRSRIVEQDYRTILSELYR